MHFHSKSIEEHEEAPLADDGRWEELVAEWSDRRGGKGAAAEASNPCYVVSVGARRSALEAEAQLAEIVGLVKAQGDEVVGYETHERKRPDPRTYLGRGVSEAIAERARACGAELVVVDAELSPSQLRNLEDMSGFSVCDREAVILNVFHRNAKTQQARIQVEIAHLEYLRPRIHGLGLDMDQQAGGVMSARGPGETASELLARRLDGRLAELRKAFGRLRRAGETQRKGREGCQRIVLVGYTNAGKTSLMNALTAAELSARDAPFETLDTTSRALARHGGDVLISDTVGFIRRLPERLLASFQSTLAEISEASLVVVVVDASDPELEMHVETTEAQLAMLGAGETPRLYVYNKTDRLASPLPQGRLLALSRGRPFVALSSRSSGAVAELRCRLVAAARARDRSARIFVPYGAAIFAELYAKCRVSAEESAERGLYLTIEGEPHVVARIERECEGLRR